MRNGLHLRNMNSSNKEKDRQYGGEVLFHDIISLRGAVANFNIANLYKNAEEFFPNKNTGPGLNL